MSMLSFKRRMFIIPRIRISAGEKGIIYYIAYKMRINELDLHYVLCVFVFDTADDSVKCYFTPTVLSKKSANLVYFHTFVLFISLRFLKNSNCKFKCNPTHS